MPNTRVTTFTIRGHAVDAYVNAKGQFWCEGPDRAETLTAPTLTALKTAANKAFTAGGKIAIPATIVELPIRLDRKHDGMLQLEDITITGIHSTNRRTLYRDEAGRPQQGYGYAGAYTQRLTPIEREELQALVTAVLRGQDAIESWLEERRISPTDAVATETARLLKESADGH